MAVHFVYIYITEFYLIFWYVVIDIHYFLSENDET